jgi:hypothetical protein
MKVIAKVQFKLFLVLIAIALTKGSFAQDIVVQTFSGSGGLNTRPFTVKDGWEIQWDAKGDIFQLYLYTGSGDMDGVPANQQGPGKGASYQAKGGNYYLQVNALEAWTIKIIQTKKDILEESVSSTKNSPVSEIANFTGSGGLSTRPFTASGPWEIQWDAKGEIFQLFLYNSAGEMDGVPANQQGPGKGASYQAKGGTYYLQVNALGTWKIKIVPVK